MTLSIVANENKRRLVFWTSFVSSPELSSCVPIFSFTLPSRSKRVSAPSSLSGASFFFESQSTPGDGENFENRVSSSSGSSTLVIISTMESEEAGIASIIKGISSASNPNSKAACCIISWKSDLAFSVP